PPPGLSPRPLTCAPPPPDSPAAPLGVSVALAPAAPATESDRALQAATISSSTTSSATAPAATASQPRRSVRRPGPTCAFAYSFVSYSRLLLHPRPAGAGHW